VYVKVHVIIKQVSTLVDGQFVFSNVLWVIMWLELYALFFVPHNIKHLSLYLSKGSLSQITYLCWINTKMNIQTNLTAISNCIYFFAATSLLMEVMFSWILCFVLTVHGNHIQLVSSSSSSLAFRCDTHCSLSPHAHDYTLSIRTTTLGFEITVLLRLL